MKTPAKIGLIFALVWASITMIIFYSGNSTAGFKVGIMINVFFLMAAVAAGLYLKRKEDGFAPTNFLIDFKTAMQAGAIYGILVSVFIYYYHENIDPSIREELVQARIAAIHEQVPDQETYEELQAGDIIWRDKSFDDYIENQEDIARSVISSFSVFIFHLMGLFFFCIFYSFFATLILRKIVLRK